MQRRGIESRRVQPRFFSFCIRLVQWAAWRVGSAQCAQSEEGEVELRLLGPRPPEVGPSWPPSVFFLFSLFLFLFNPFLLHFEFYLNSNALGMPYINLG